MPEFGGEALEGKDAATEEPAEVTEPGGMNVTMEFDVGLEAEG